MEGSGIADNSALHFLAKRVAAEELTDLESFVVGFAQGIDGSGTCLTFQRGIGSLDDGRYSVSNELGATVYGGVAAYTLERNSLIVRLNERGADDLGIPPTVIIDFSVDEPTWQAVSHGLRQVLGSRPDS